ncbi:MAG TPA: hypothetical protein ENF95_01025 [Candidatus Aenigmarchaeota archaeon]|nr:hypothetical protein [Candidatus Aenigmarchaeota archaeon]
MGGKIPNPELVKRIIYYAMKKRGVVHTQDELAEIVRKELQKLNKKFTITPHRVRKIALQIENMEVTVKTKKSNKPKPKKCPVCGSKLKPIYAKNLLGEKVTVGFKCNICHYHADEKMFAPMKYEFRLLKK